MPFLFDRPDPQQAVPGDLGGLRGNLLQLLLGPGGGYHEGTRNSAGIITGPGGYSLGPGSVLGRLGGFANHNPGEDVLGPLAAQYQQNFQGKLNALNNNVPNRFSSEAMYQTGQLQRQESNDYNVLSSQILQQGQDQQMRAIMSLLGPALGPTFGGPFTQGSSPWENILGGASAIGALLPGGGMGHKG